MAKGKFAARNAQTVNRRPEPTKHDAHVVTWIWSEQRAYENGHIAAINGQVVQKGGAA